MVIQYYIYVYPRYTGAVRGVGTEKSYTPWHNSVLLQYYGIQFYCKFTVLFL